MSACGQRFVAVVDFVQEAQHRYSSSKPDRTTPLCGSICEERVKSSRVCSSESGRFVQDRLLCCCGISVCLCHMEALFIATRSVGRGRSRISLASSHEVERRGFCPHSRSKLPLSGDDLPDPTDLRGFSGNLSDPTFTRLDRGWSISRYLEQTRLFFSDISAERCRARSDGTFCRQPVLAFLRSHL